MRTMVMSLLAAALVAGSTMRAAPDQVRPGEMTEAKVWIQNRSRAQAIPVDLRNVDLEAPLRVQVASLAGWAATGIAASSTSTSPT